MANLCEGCVQKRKADCRIFISKPKEKTCYQTVEDAIQIELSILDYIKKHPDTEDERIAQSKAIAERKLNEYLSLKEIEVASLPWE